MIKTAVIGIGIIVPLAAQPVNDDCGCEKDLDNILYQMFRNYPLFSRANLGNPGVSPDSRTQELKDQMSSVKDCAECDAKLAEFMKNFDDPRCCLTDKKGVLLGGEWSVTTAPGDTARFEEQDSGFVYLRIPDCSEETRKRVEKFAAAKAFAAAPYLIIDIRGNRGGSDNPFAAIIPLLYTNTIERCFSMLATNDNFYQASRIEKERDGFALSRRSFCVLQEQISQNNQGGMAELTDTLRLREVRKAPRKAAVMIDRFVDGNAQRFAADALQSDKAYVFGARTSGKQVTAMIMRLDLPSGKRSLRVPTSIVTYPERVHFNNGIGPDIAWPRACPDTLAFVKEQLRKAK